MSKRNHHTHADRSPLIVLARRAWARELPIMDDELNAFQRAARLYATRSRTGRCRARRQTT